MLISDREEWESILNPGRAVRPRSSSNISASAAYAPSRPVSPTSSRPYSSPIIGTGSASRRVLTEEEEERQKKIEEENIAKAKADLELSKLKAAQRILNDPVARKKQPDFFIKELEAIASGKPKDQGGVGGFLKDVGGEIGKGALYALQRPVAVVASTLKELSDIPSGKASITDWASQSVAKDTTISKYLGKTGNRWLDVTIGLIADIAGDPLTWVTFGGSAVASRMGRMNLVAQASTEEVLKRAPTLGPKIADGSLIRYGEWALDDVERAVLNRPKGVSLSFGSQKTLGTPGKLSGKVSAGAAGVVGKPLSRLRGNVGTIPALGKLQDVTSAASIRAAGLSRYGRAGYDKTMEQTVKSLAGFRAGVRSDAAGKVFAARHAASNKDLIGAAAEHEASGGRKIYQILEGSYDPTVPLTPEEIAVADGVRGIFDSVLSGAVEVTEETAARRRFSPIDIGHQDKYVHHTLNPKAREWIFAQNPNSTMMKSISPTLEVGGGGLVNNPRALMARKLEAGSEFLGETIPGVPGTSAKIDDINAISNKVLGFDWFETDASTYINNYIDSVSKKVRQVSFVDTMYEYGPSAVRNLERVLVPDQDVIKALRFSERTLKKTIGALRKSLYGEVKEVGKISKGQRKLAQKIVDAKEKELLLSSQQTGDLLTGVYKAESELASARELAASRGGEILEGFDTVTAPYRAKLNSLKSSIEANKLDETLATAELEDVYRKVFPDADEIPSDPKVMAREILADKGTGVPVKDQTRALRDALKASGKVSTVEGVTAEGLPNVVTRTTLKAEREIAKNEAIVAKKTEALTKELSKDPLALDAYKARVSAETAATEAAAKFDTSMALMGTQREWMENVGAVYKQEVDDLRKVVDDMPEKSSTREIISEWLDGSQRTLDSLQSAPMEQPVKDALERVLIQTRGLESDLAMAEGRRDLAKFNLERAVLGQLDPKEIVTKTLDGWKAIEDLGVQISPEAREVLFGAMERLSTPQGWIDFQKHWNAYNTFFKVSAMLTPGFIVRNAYTAAFNNFVAGVSPRESIQATRFIRRVNKDGLDAALQSVPENMRDIYLEGYKATIGSGAGQTLQDILVPINGSRAQKIMNFYPIRKWADANKYTEDVSRFALGLNGAKRGLFLEDNIANISRFHFNYSDLSKLDEWAKMVIPFWTFASRNIPLQLVNQVARPAVYRAYERVREEFPVDENLVLAPWASSRNPMGLPWDPNAVLMPDLPQIDMSEQIRMMTDPMRLVSQMNPIIRTPIELAGGRQLGLDIPFSETPQEVRGPTDQLAYLLAKMYPFGGANAEVNPTTGNRQMSPKVNYALSSLFPTFGTIQRLIPELGGKEGYTDRVGSSRWNALGVPYRRFSPSEQVKELTRRDFEMKNALSAWTKSGYLTPKK